MLYIVRENGDTHDWHVGETKPARNPSIGSEPFMDVCEIQADGHELEHIRKNFSNLPMCGHKAVVTWKWGWAQFIYDHLGA